MSKTLSLLVRTIPLGLACASAAGAATTIQIVADNDFAVYAGTATAISRSVYQNNVVWSQQLAAASSFTFDLEGGETTFYLLALGAGTTEDNISGRINGVNIVEIFQQNASSVLQSNSIRPFLGGYSDGAVANGTFTPVLADVQASLSQVTWGPPTPITGATVVGQNPFAQIGGQRWGFDVPDYQAVFFRFDAQSVGVPVAIPEAGNAAALLGLVTLATTFGRRRGR
jgi:hypothetical protein